jgi:hypothetical protein
MPTYSADSVPNIKLNDYRHLANRGVGRNTPLLDPKLTECGQVVDMIEDLGWGKKPHGWGKKAPC